ncbi:MAG: BrnA antitoxin family protein [Bacteroidia bacterium]|nr:BrnA antitoxin family protein [Bacteroidia bacterium]
MANNKLSVPNFTNEDEEREYWAKFDLSEHLKAEDFQNISFPDLKPSFSAVSLRIPRYILIRLKEKAHAVNISYQSLMKKYITDGLFSEVK